MAEGGWSTLSRLLLGLGTWLDGVGEPNPDSTGDVGIVLRHMPTPFMPLSQKGIITNDGIWRHWGATPIHSEGSALSGW